jgi:hypothetical protein
MKKAWCFALASTLGMALTVGACGGDDDDDDGSPAKGSSGAAGGSQQGSGGGTGAGGGNAGGTNGSSGGGNAGGGAGGASGAAGGAGAGGAGRVTFATLVEKYRSCDGCHGPAISPPMGGFTLSYDIVKNNNVIATCGSSTKYIDLENPEQSFLYVKLAPAEALPFPEEGCGSKMPLNTDGDEKTANAFLAWIRDGAPEK